MIVSCGLLPSFRTRPAQPLSPSTRIGGWFRARAGFAEPAGFFPAGNTRLPVFPYQNPGAAGAKPRQISNRKKQGEKPRKILFIGTPGSGKTTLATRLSQDTGLPFVSIDDCRIRYSDGTELGEERAWDHFLAECRRPVPAILEFSGMGLHVVEVRDSLLLSKMPVSVIWLVLPFDTCIARARSRKKPVPYPYPWAPLEYALPLVHDGIDFAWEIIWCQEPQFHAMRREFSGIETVNEMYAAVRKICQRL